jgi:hypothetical protein
MKQMKIEFKYPVVFFSMAGQNVGDLISFQRIKIHGGFIKKEHNCPEK